MPPAPPARSSPPGERAVFDRWPVLACQLGRDGHDARPERRVGHPALLDRLGRDTTGRAGRDGEEAALDGHPLLRRHAEGVGADHPAAEVEERPAGVAGVDPRSLSGSALTNAAVLPAAADGDHQHRRHRSRAHRVAGTAPPRAIVLLGDSRRRGRRGGPPDDPAFRLRYGPCDTPPRRPLGGGSLDARSLSREGGRVPRSTGDERRPTAPATPGTASVTPPAVVHRGARP